ncbi:hypothetical protein M8A51_20840 [Schlegelella sp. S2-27]|uniref:Uncharacterized protein n=1 Tax=Caldimonas mangrovi TaxID=2944811 RepID=A0ABT0YTA5_9BURK|nr:hypothetical protein [Caldimonas mangrovi]MCM5681982.1 hypothetical protein [Caldimonas mangrovi]
MKRFVLYCGGAAPSGPQVGPEEAAAATRAEGAKVVAAGTGTLIVDAELPQIKRISRLLPGWSYTAETRSVRKPAPPRRKAA